MRYEYKVVPAPTRGEKAKGVKAPEGRFALALEHVLNDMGAEGWEFQRAETLPSEERAGLTSSVTVWRNVLVFRRALAVPEVAGLLTGPERSAEVPRERAVAAAAAGLGAAGFAMKSVMPAVQTPAAEPETQAPASQTPDETQRSQTPSDASQDADWQRPVPTQVSELEADNGVEETRDVDATLSFLQQRAARQTSES